MMMLLPSWYALGALLVMSVSASVGMRRTPFGFRHTECVVEVPNGATVDEDPEGYGLRITHTNGSFWQHETPRVCMEAAAAERAARQAKAAAGDPSCNATPCSCDTLPCNNWIDNAGSMNVKRFIGGMSSTYVVPGTPLRTTSGQTLFYFIGAENTDGTPRSGNPPPSGRAILQPVLTFDPSNWCKGSTTGWCFSSWYCCPQNVATHSPYIQNVEPGDQFLGLFNLSADGTMFETVSMNVATGQKTTLKCPRQSRNFNWADVTQEVYAMENCDDFAEGPMEFRNVRLWDTNWQDMNPAWLLTSNKPCKGVIAQNGTTFTVSHSNDLSKSL